MQVAWILYRRENTMGRKYNILQKVETKMKLERGEDENDLITKEMIKEAEEKRKKDTDIFYQKYYKPETSHLAASARAASALPTASMSTSATS